MNKQTAEKTVQNLNSQTYILSYGEYERPDYSIRKQRGSDNYEIRVRYYFYTGTLYPKKSGVLHPEMVHMANY